jgi:hypothetical protein
MFMDVNRIKYVNGTKVEMTTEEIAARDAEEAAYQPPAAPTTYRLYKSTLIRRVTEQEAVVLSAVLDAAPVKSKMLWDASEWLDNADPLFTDLSAAIAGALGAKRAAEILGRE